MKTKLLKKIRKQYSVVYYPDGMLLGGKYLIYKGCYIVYKKMEKFVVCSSIYL